MDINLCPPDKLLLGQMDINLRPHAELLTEQIDLINCYLIKWT